MNKMLLVMMLTLSVVFSPITLFAESSMAINFKDYKLKHIGQNKVKIMYKKNKAIIEVINKNRFKVNGVTVVWNSSETMKSALEKVNKAYKASRKKNAFLDLMVQEAHAMPMIPLIMTAFGMGVTGLISYNMGKNSCANNAGASGAPASQ